jgi:hypothetical protein
VCTPSQNGDPYVAFYNGDVCRSTWLPRALNVTFVCAPERVGNIFMEI